MIDKFNALIESRLFQPGREGELSETDIQLAAAVLMLEVVKVDGHVDRTELSEVIGVLRTHLLLDGEQIGRLLEMASGSKSDLQHLDLFTLKLRENWGQEERLRLLSDFWIIAAADDVIDEREKILIERIAALLDLNEEEIDRAGHQARHWLEFRTT